MLLQILTILTIHGIYSQNAFDDYLRTYDSTLRLWVFGYNNPGNTGINRGCCYKKTEFTCEECKYKINLRVLQSDYETLNDANYIYQVGVFSKPAESLFETLYFEKLYSWAYIMDFDINILNADMSSTIPIETSQRMSWMWYGNYEFDAVYGIYNRIQSWSIISLLNNGYAYVSTINIILQTVVFNRYQFTNGECCTQNPDDIDNKECKIPCSFYVKLNNGMYDLIRTSEVMGQNHSSIYSYNLTLVYHTYVLSYRNTFVKLVFMSMKGDKELDVMEIKSLNLLRKRKYYYENVIGINNNIVANLSINLYCVKTAGILCKKYCNEYRYVDSCDNEDGVPVCLNGASDLRKCENNPYVLCNKNPCLNNGTCKVIGKDSTTCLCPNGFSGQFCEEVDCAQDCNNRGVCNLPGKCMCEHPFFGDSCEFEECNTTISKLCQYGGLCYYEGNVPKCRCIEGRSTGKYCEIPLCDGKCMNGICMKNLYYDIMKCICYEGYEGKYCEISKPIDKPAKYPAITVFIVILALLTLLMITIIVLMHKGFLTLLNVPAPTNDSSLIANDNDEST